MRPSISALLTPGALAFSLMALCACSEPEPAGPATDPASPPVGAPTAGAPAAAPTVDKGPKRGPGELHLPTGAGQPLEEVGPPTPPPGEPTGATFEEGVPSVALSVTATGFDADAELEIVELIEGDFGTTRPRVVHIEPLQGRESFEIAAPESLRGTFHVMVLHNKTIDPAYSGMADAIVLTGQPVSVSVAKGDSPAWMKKLPIGEAPENTIPDTPTPGPEGKPPEGNGPPGPPPAASE